MSSQTQLSKPPKHFYEFGPFRLDPIEHLLLRDGNPVSLTPKAFETLLTLVENSGHVLNRNRLLDEIWPNTFVEESTVAQNIFTLRKALGERPGGEQYIETVPRRGYRFIAPVRRLYDQDLQRSEDQQPDPGSILEEARTDSLDEARNRAAIPQDAKKIKTWKDGIRVVTFVGVSLGIVFGSYLLWKSLKRETQSRSIKVLAVLPFESLNPGDAGDLLGLGMSDALITKLTNIKQIVVLPTSAVFKYSGLQQEPVAVGKVLKVDLVLVGRIQKVNDRIRVTVQLINVEDGTTMWADKFDEKFIDIFGVQDVISQRLVDALTLKLSNKEQEVLRKQYTRNSEAYHAYLKGRYYYNKWTGDGFRESIQYFQKSIESDAEYTMAYAGMADAYNALMSYNYTSPKEAMSQAKSAANKALAIDELLAEGHSALAATKMLYDWDWSSAETEFRRAIELDPSYAMAHLSYGCFLIAMGRFDEAELELKRAHELDPVSLVINTCLGLPDYYSGRYSRAVEQYQNTLKMDPNFGLTHAALGDVYLAEKEYEKAIAQYQLEIAIVGRNSGSLASVGYTYGVSGKKTSAMRVIKDLKELSRQQYVSPLAIATVYIGVGNKDEAFRWLERAYDDRSNRLAYLRVQPIFNSLRADERFVSLLQRIGL